MKIQAKRPATKTFLLISASLFCFLFVAVAGCQYLASVFSERNDLSSLQRAVRLQPLNAEYRYRLGLYFSLLNPDAAAESFRTAVSLNPYRADYWLALARAYNSMGDAQAQDPALRNALKMGPTDPAIVWEAANVYFSSGDTAETLHLCGRLLNDPGPAFGHALPFCWRVKPDVDLFISELMPPQTDAYESFLNLLISNQETAAANKAWGRLVSLGNPILRPRVFEYVNFLLIHKQPDLALQVWQQAAPLANLSKYQPSTNNLVVNGNFGLPILKAGFDWAYQKGPRVSLALDTEQHYAGNRSLSLSFDDAQIEDAGIRQFILVHPNRTYDFSANFKAQQIEGAGGIRFALEDAYTRTLVFATDNLTDTNDWKQLNGTFTAGPETNLLMLRLQRIPAGDVIKGKLWIDGLRLTEQPQQQP
jgi:tetratricopeptide (TPR) repeat protein